jgi:hypothetical protein
MNQTVPTIIKARDIAIGFFGWITFHNLYFFLLIGRWQLVLGRIFDGSFGWTVFLWLPLVIAPFVVFAKKRIWVGTGIVAAIIINIAIWIVLNLVADGLPYWSAWAFLTFPFPLGIYLFMS